MRELEVRAVIEFDEREGLGFLAFRDSQGQLIEGSGGIDSLMAGFEHGRARCTLPSRYRQLLALAAEHGGRWHPTRGFAVREEVLPDLLRAVRALPEQSTAQEDPSVSGLIVDARPVRAAEHVDIVGEEELVRETRLESSDGTSVPVEAVLAQAKSRLWIRVGKTFQRRPELTSDEMKTIGKAVRLTGDEVPFFLAKQLKRLEAERKVYLSDRAQAAKVAGQSPWLTEVSVELSDEGRLRLGVGFLAAGSHIPWSNPTQSGQRRRFVRVGEDQWVWNDPRAQRNARAALDHIPGVEALPTPGQFEAPAQALPLVQETFAQLGTVRLSDSAEALRRKLMGFDGIGDYPTPRGLTVQLRPYQKAGYNWLSFLRTYGLGGVLADDMGLGKTVQTLASVLAACEGGDDAASIVVCPASVTNVWESEIERWCKAIRGFVLTGQNRSRYLRAPPRKSVAIVSYSGLARNVEEFRQVVWNYAILDEAHRIKNPSTAQAKACKSLVAKHRLAVTGTPVQNRLAELWSIFDFLMQGYLGTARHFERTFEIPITHHADHAAAASLRKRIDPFKLRRTKREVAADLPPLTEQVLSVEMNPEQRQLYDRILRNDAPELIARLKADRRATILVLEKLLRLRQVAAHPRLVDGDFDLRGTSGKFEAFVDLLDDALEEVHKVLVFSQWTKMADLVRLHLRSLESHGLRHLYLDGRVPVGDRRDLIAEFQEEGGPQVMVLSLLAGGEGITLTEADVVVLYDRWWNPAVEEQAIARAHRIGQDVPVTAYILEARATIEERLADLLRRKKALASTVVTVDEIEKTVTREELLQLLQEELEAATHDHDAE